MLVYSHLSLFFALFFFFNDTATTEIYTLSLHDALPILCKMVSRRRSRSEKSRSYEAEKPLALADRKSTRLNSSHEWISYAVFCLKKKKKKKIKKKDKTREIETSCYVSGT